MVESLVLYLLFFFFVFCICFFIKSSKDKRNETLIKVFLLVICGLFIGLRYDVGVDYMAYLEEFNIAKYQLNHRFEFIPRITQYFLSSQDWPYYIWFVLMATIQMWLLVKFFKGKLKLLLPIGVLMFFFMYLASITNIIRHMCAVLVFLNAIKFIQNKKFIHYCLVIFIGGLFHRSIFIMLPFYFLNKVDFTALQTKIQLIILVCSIVFSNFFIRFIDFFLDIFSYVGYSYVAGRFDLDNTLMVEEGTGLGRIINWLLIFIVVVYNKGMRNFFDNFEFNYRIIYNLFFLSAILYEFSGHILYFQRALLYFSITNFIMYTFLIYYCLMLKERKVLKYRIIGISTLSLEFVFFVKMVVELNHNLAPLKFISL